MICATPSVFDRDVELVVADPARQIEIGRSHARPAPVRHRRLRVQHRAVPFEHPYAAFQKRAVTGPRHARYDREVARAGNEEPHVDAVARRRAQRLHVRRDAEEIRIREPQRARRHCGNELIEPVKTREVRERREHTQRNVSGRSHVRRRRQVRGRERRSRHRPHLRERFLEIRDGRSLHFDPRIAPGFDAARRVSDPFSAHAQSAYITDGAVDRDQLAVIAREPAEGAVQARPVEAAHAAAGLHERPPQARARNAQVAEPVVYDAHGHARPRALRRARSRTRARSRRPRRCNARRIWCARRQRWPRATRESSRPRP